MGTKWQHETAKTFVENFAEPAKILFLYQSGDNTNAFKIPQGLILVAMVARGNSSPMIALIFFGIILGSFAQRQYAVFDWWTSDLTCSSPPDFSLAVVQDECVRLESPFFPRYSQVSCSTTILGLTLLTFQSFLDPDCTQPDSILSVLQILPNLLGSCQQVSG